MSDQDTGPPTDASYAAFVRTTWAHHLRVARLLTFSDFGLPVTVERP